MKIENIKFKAKRLDNGEWIEGNLVKSYLNSKEHTHIIPIFNTTGDIKVVEVNPSTVCQFTGLKDCEGKEVWEGDILEGESKCEIIFIKGTFSTHSIDGNGRVHSYPLCYFEKKDGMVDSKVIENKFDKEK